MKGSPDILAKIFERRRERLREEIARHPREEIHEAGLTRRRSAAPHAFAWALGVRGRVNVIAEFKRASPSKGVIRDDLGAAETARAYKEGGACALSVLTEGDHFRGSLGDLEEARAAARLPVLRKDFIFDDYQVYESAAAGADALLLIASMLDDDALARLRRLTEDELGMDALVEVHMADEMRRADAAGARIIGVNNRDLRTFRVSLETSFELARRAPAGRLLVSESGIRDHADIRRLTRAGFNAFLIGETPMRAERPGEILKGLVSGQ
jgi:indole-3-glycerol phosphate synthase